MTATLDAPLVTAEPPPPARHRPDQSSGANPRWVRPSWWALMVATAFLYIWGVGASGTANSFYAAAVQAGTKSWKAMLFGSIDSSNFITVDKPPASLWVMEISGRIFGFSSWSMLVPQAVEGVLAVALVYATVKRFSGPAAGLLAGFALAVTPAAALMFRFNNPDALLVLLMAAGAYCTVRALEAGKMTWLMLAGAAIGFGFLTKMGQAMLVVPAFGLVYLVAAPISLRRRLGHLIAAVAALIVSCGWWVALVALWPASARPYIGGSTDNNPLELAFGYNGLGRLFGGSGNGGGGGGAQGSSFGGATGLNRLFSAEMGVQISWLIPAALIGLVVSLILRGRAPRTDRVRAALILWGGWLLFTGVTFSYMQGTIHPYYTVALAPAVAALVAISAREMWINRAQLLARIGLAAMVASSAAWGFHLLDQTPTWFPPLRYVVAISGLIGAVGFLVPAQRLGKAVIAVVAMSLIGGFGGTTAYALATSATTHSGSIPSVGPSISASSTGGMGGGGGGFGGGTRPSGTGGQTGTAPSGTRPSGTKPTGNMPTGGGSTDTGTAGTGSTGAATAQGGGSTSSAQLVALLKKTTTTWSAATVGSQTSAPLELSSGTAIMTIGGFNGSDATPTLAAFKAYVAAGKIHYFIAGGSGGGGGAGGSSSVGSQIAAWVAANYKSTTVGGSTVYDLTTTK